VALQLLVDGASLLVEVRNEAAPGLFSATVETDGGDGGPPPPMPATWALTDSHRPVQTACSRSAR
jgi:hypothetical protein